MICYIKVQYHIAVNATNKEGYSPLVCVSCRLTILQTFRGILSEKCPIQLGILLQDCMAKHSKTATFTTTAVITFLLKEFKLRVMTQSTFTNHQLSQ